MYDKRVFRGNTHN
jgi:hypothetical protein